MIMKEEILQLFLEDLARSSLRVQKSRLYYAQKFLDFAEGVSLGEWNKSLVWKFQEQLEREGYSKGTVRFILSIVPRVFAAAQRVHERNRQQLISEVDASDPTAVAQVLKALSMPGPAFDLGKRWLPRVADSDMARPRPSLEEVERTIGVAKEIPELAFNLGLASIYGMRREELLEVAREDIDYELGTIFIRRAKGGEQRKWLLAEELIPYLKDYPFPPQSPFKLSRLFWKLEWKAGIEHQYGAGWHSYRGLLDKLLVDAFGEVKAHIFLGWKLSSSSEMTLRYYTRGVIPLDVDAEVLAKHPFIGLWK